MAQQQDSTPVALRGTVKRTSNGKLVAQVWSGESVQPGATVTVDGTTARVVDRGRNFKDFRNVGWVYLYLEDPSAAVQMTASAPAVSTHEPTWQIDREDADGGPYVVGETIANPGRRIGSSQARARVALPSGTRGPLELAAARAWDAVRAELRTEGQRVAQELGVTWQLDGWYELIARKDSELRLARWADLADQEQSAWKAWEAARKADGGALDALADDDGPEYLTVVRATRRWIPEDGDSFGLSTWSGYLYTATVRAATEAEATPVREAAAARQAEREQRRERRSARKALADRIRSEGERPEGSTTIDGETVASTQTLYGGGDWFVVTDDHVWYVRNNGADGDDWSLNNVRTGGAGAIGWRVARTDDLVTAVRALVG